MVLKAWAARQQHRSQVDEMVLASGISGVTYGITINAKTISLSFALATAPTATSNGISYSRITPAASCAPIVWYWKWFPGTRHSPFYSILCCASCSTCA